MKKTTINIKSYFLVSFLSILLITSCTFTFTSDIDFNTKPPVVTTLEPTDITDSGMTLWGELNDTGNDEIEEVGFYINTTGETFKVKDRIECSFDSSVFSLTLNNLQLGTKYYVVAYAENDAGTGTGLTIEVSTNSFIYGSFTDTRDGRTYKTIEIGEQTWLAENFGYLPAINDSLDLSKSEPKYYLLSYSGSLVDDAKTTAYYQKYGVLYNWSAALTVAPDGWKLPSKAELEMLMQYVGDNIDYYDINGDEWYNIGRHLKSKEGWSGGGYDTFGFNVLCSNLLFQNGMFWTNDVYTYLWTSDEMHGYSAYAARIQKFQDSVQLTDMDKRTGASVRLLKIKD